MTGPADASAETAPVASALPPSVEAARAVDLIVWPDPRLRKKCLAIEPYDDHARAVASALAERMFEVMREHKGVGLAASQVGVLARMFVMNATGEPEDDRVIINPVLSEPDGTEEAEEGCLSLPKINTPVIRSEYLRLQAIDLHGNPIDEVGEGFIARVWQHETDHLNGVLLLDKMGPTEKMRHRKAVRNLQDDWDDAHPPEEKPAKPRRRFGRRRK